MTTLVTGATGFVGINLVRLLVSRGQKVRVFARRSRRPRLGLEGLDVETAEGDVTDPESVARAMKGVRRVYHVAGATSQGPWASTRRWLTKVNVEGTEHVCAAARAAGVERLVHTSSIVAVGHGPKDAPATERTEWNFARLGSPYYDTKREAEYVVRRHVEQGLDAVIVNPGFMLGPWDAKPTSNEAVLNAARWRRGLPIYPARGGINALDVEDAALGHVLAMDKGKKGERYVLGAHNVTWRELFTEINSVCGKPAPWLPLWTLPTYPVALALTAIGRFAPRRLASANTLTLRAGNVEHYLSSERATRELGLPTTPLRRSIEKSLDWFRKNGYLDARA